MSKELVKGITLRAAFLISAVWRLVPFRVRKFIWVGLTLLESQSSPKLALIRLFEMQDSFDAIKNYTAMRLGNGRHPKHDLIGYHRFFSDCIGRGERVLDVGCGHGWVARSIAENKPTSEVIGVDIKSEVVDKARAFQSGIDNLSFYCADATINLPFTDIDVVVLSNVLEHIDDRISFLRKLRHLYAQALILIRVPCLERSWEIAMRQNIGVDYFLDDEHFIEYTEEDFRKEVVASGLSIEGLSIQWGEIWAKLR